MTRVFVTGLGAVSPCGMGVAPLWKTARAGAHAIRELELFDPSDQRTRLAGEFSGETHAGRDLLPAARRRLSRTDRFALAAAREAVDHAGLDSGAPWRNAGVFFGTSTGGMQEGEQLYPDVVTDARGAAARRRFLDCLAQPLGSPAEAVARALGARGPVETSAAACAASTQALEVALGSLREGEVQLALVGGADGLCRLTYGGFNSLRAVSPMPSRPFRQGREGLSLGEGAGALVLETEEHARARGATPLAELAGAGTSCDAYHMTAPQPEGRGAALAMSRALADAELSPARVDFVNAHGTGTPHNDAAEWNALREVFGERAGRVPVTSTKGVVGHLLGACGALEAVVTVLCLREGEVHPTPGQGEPDPEAAVDLVVGAPRSLRGARVGVTVNLAFGGANAAAVFRRVDVASDDPLDDGGAA